LPSVRHVASAVRTPGFVLQLVTQLDATFARLLFVTVGSGDGMLANLIENASTTPVVRAPAAADVNLVALQCAKALALEDTVVFGRVLLVQANTRSAILQADAALNTPPPA
jgi:phosphoribosylcarboxyaminoimidazole (NCAIR) mutase